MACNRGRANPNQNTRLRLFADSAGYCQNPNCTHALFVDLDSGATHVAEMAHIFAATDGGPRSKAELSDEERGAYENLILLCANCHTMIDKAANDFPDAMIASWKRDRIERLAMLFGAVHLPTREAVRSLIEPLMRENKHILDNYGPETDARYDPESNGAKIWTRKVISKILPNNRRMLSILDANADHMMEDESAALEAFRQHIDDLAARHLEGIPGGRRYPNGMRTIMAPR